MFSRQTFQQQILGVPFSDGKSFSIPEHAWNYYERARVKGTVQAVSRPAAHAVDLTAAASPTPEPSPPLSSQLETEVSSPLVKLARLPSDDHAPPGSIRSCRIPKGDPWDGAAVAWAVYKGFVPGVYRNWYVYLSHSLCVARLHRTFRSEIYPLVEPCTKAEYGAFMSWDRAIEALRKQKARVEFLEKDYQPTYHQLSDCSRF